MSTLSYTDTPSRLYHPRHAIADYIRRLLEADDYFSRPFQIGQESRAWTFESPLGTDQTDNLMGLNWFNLEVVESLPWAGVAVGNRLSYDWPRGRCTTVIFTVTGGYVSKKNLLTTDLDDKVSELLGVIDTIYKTNLARGIDITQLLPTNPPLSGGGSQIITANAEIYRQRDDYYLIKTHHIIETNYVAC